MSEASGEVFKSSEAPKEKQGTDRCKRQGEVCGQQGAPRCWECSRAGCMDPFVVSLTCVLGICICICGVF